MYLSFVDEVRNLAPSILIEVHREHHFKDFKAQTCPEWKKVLKNEHFQTVTFCWGCTLNRFLLQADRISGNKTEFLVGILELK